MEVWRYSVPPSSVVFRCIPLYLYLHLQLLALLVLRHHVLCSYAAMLLCCYAASSCTYAYLSITYSPMTYSPMTYHLSTAARPRPPRRAMLLCCSASLLLCFSASLLLCFSAALLLCFSAALLLCFSAALLLCCSASLLLCCSAALHIYHLCSKAYQLSTAARPRPPHRAVSPPPL
jgi:hypothetical protein